MRLLRLLGVLLLSHCCTPSCLPLGEQFTGAAYDGKAMEVLRLLKAGVDVNFRDSVRSQTVVLGT